MDDGTHHPATDDLQDRQTPPSDERPAGRLFSPLRMEHVLRLAPAEDAALLRQQKRWIRIHQAVVLVRSIGWGAGILAVLAFAPLILVGSTALSKPLHEGGALAEVLSLLGLLFVGLLVAWFYLYVLVGWLAPSTQLSQRIQRVEFCSRGGRLGLSRGSATLTLEASGRLARTFFRVVAGRWINVGVRPDLSNDVVTLAQSIMIAVPEGGADELRQQPEKLRRYRAFVQDVAGLCVLQRLDLIPGLVEANADILRSAAPDEEMSRYIHPMARRSSLEAFTEFIVPASAILLSLVAIVVTVMK